MRQRGPLEKANNAHSIMLLQDAYLKDPNISLFNAHPKRAIRLIKYTQNAVYIFLFVVAETGARMRCALVQNCRVGTSVLVFICIIIVNQTSQLKVSIIVVSVRSKRLVKDNVFSKI